ncbi:MAG: hypothetical protein WCO78_03485 [Candidatus Roizmanbacteria bacterium]
MKLIPAPLSTNRDECKAQFQMLLPYFSHFQIDIQDGIYVPNKTIGVSEYLEVIDELLENSLTAVIPGLSRNLDPGITQSVTSSLDDNQVVVDMHLMLSDYEKTFESIRLYFLDPVRNLPRTMLRGRDDIVLRCVFVHTNIDLKLLEQYKDLPLSMTFSPPDSPDDWADFLRSSAHAQVMTIHPGPQGQAFMPQMLSKVGQIHEINSHVNVCIDGAVNDRTYPLIRSASPHCVPDELAVGSYFSKATPQDIPDRIKLLSD